MNPTSTPKVWVVDVCGTLVRDDTTLGLLRYHFDLQSDTRARHFVFRALTARYSPIRLGMACVEKLTGRHVLKHAVVRLLAGTPVGSLEQSASVYAQWLLDTRRIVPVKSILDNVGASDTLVLASASLEPVVRQLAAQLGARYVASVLEERDGILTGHYSVDLTGRKLQALQSEFGPALLQASTAISDNYTDRDLLEAVGKAYVVLHRNVHRARWQGLDASFLGLDE